MSDAGFTTRFALAALATWRVTHLLANEDGPGDAVVRLRARLGAGPAGRLMDCFQCLSIWIAAPMTLVVSREPERTPDVARAVRRRLPARADGRGADGARGGRAAGEGEVNRMGCCGQSGTALKPAQTPARPTRPLGTVAVPTTAAAAACSGRCCPGAYPRRSRRGVDPVLGTIGHPGSGTATGRIYEFSADAPTQAVDPRDAAALLASGFFRGTA